MDGSDPPFLLPGAGEGVRRNLHLRRTPSGGSLPSKLSLQEGPEEERGPGGPVPPDPPVAPEPRAAHIAASEPDARRGGAGPPEPPGCEETHTNQRSFQRGTGLRLDDLTPLWKIRDFPQGASFCFQFNLATDLPSPQPHPGRLLSPLDRWKQDRVLLIARAPDLADHLAGGGRAEESPFPRSTPEAPGHRPGAYTQPPVRSLWANTGRLAGLFFTISRESPPEGVSSDVSAGDGFAPAFEAGRKSCAWDPF